MFDAPVDRFVTRVRKCSERPWRMPSRGVRLPSQATGHHPGSIRSACAECSRESGILRMPYAASVRRYVQNYLGSVGSCARIAPRPVFSLCSLVSRVLTGVMLRFQSSQEFIEDGARFLGMCVGLLVGAREVSLL
jgi:hypothetical protein